MRKNNIIKLLIGMIILSLFTLNSYSIIYLNQGGSGGGFVEGGSEIEYYIITGANYFLKSHSDTQKFLSEVEIMEMTGKDFTILSEILDSAINNMESAEIEFVKLKIKADITPYNQSFITGLVSFDYTEFKIENNLNSTVFNEVSGYLSIGNLNGLFDKSLQNVQDIILKMKEIQTYINGGTYPDNNLFWRLNQKFSESQLFGQYASEVFHEISGN